MGTTLPKDNVQGCARSLVPPRQIPIEERVGDVAPVPNTITSQGFWLLAWIVNNIGITMLNKYAFSVSGFHYPLATSAFHMACNWLGTTVYFNISGSERTVIERSQWLSLLTFSVIFSMNISVGNVSSMLVSVKFNQVMRSLVPAIVMVLGAHLFKKSYSTPRKLAVVPIVCGVALACYGEMEIDFSSFIVTVFCVLLAALKVVVSGEMLTGNMKMPPLDLLSYMAPLALVHLSLGSFIFGEAGDIVENWDTLSAGSSLWVVLITGLGSFSLNLCSLQANKVTSPLTLSIMANVKQVLLIAFSMLAFTTPTTALNIIGIITVVISSFRYSLLSVMEGKRQTKHEEDRSDGPTLPK